MGEPVVDGETCEHLLDVLGEFVARAGAEALLLPPVEPGEAAFPEPWAETRAGVTLLLRRLAWHAGIASTIEVEDRRVGERPTERKPATRVPLREVRRGAAVFDLEFLGSDDIAGTLAHEIGVAFAVRHPPARVAPYRTADAPTRTPDPDLDLERGSIATVYLGLGVLAANAARQSHSVLEGQGFNPLLVARVGVELEAGYVPASSLAYLLAVQAALRGDLAPPPGLSPGQHREVEDWLPTLDRDGLRARLGIAADATPGARPAPKPFADAVLAPDEPRGKTAFRWHTRRTGVGFLAGLALGAIASVVVGPPFALACLLVGPIAGYLLGRNTAVVRCSGCAGTLHSPSHNLARSCPACGAVLRGDIASLSERLDAEEAAEDRAAS